MRTDCACADDGAEVCEMNSPFVRLAYKNKATRTEAAVSERGCVLNAVTESSLPCNAVPVEVRC